MGLEFVVNLRCFSATMEKTLKNRDKTVFFQGFCWFLNVFRRLFNFGWKTAQFDNKFESLEVSHFFWTPKSPLARINIEMEEILNENATVAFSQQTVCTSLLFSFLLLLLHCRMQMFSTLGDRLSIISTYSFSASPALHPPQKSSSERAQGWCIRYCSAK